MVVAEVVAVEEIVVIVVAAVIEEVVKTTTTTANSNTSMRQKDAVVVEEDAKMTVTTSKKVNHRINTINRAKEIVITMRSRKLPTRTRIAETLKMARLALLTKGQAECTPKTHDCRSRCRT